MSIIIQCLIVEVHNGHIRFVQRAQMTVQTSTASVVSIAVPRVTFAGLTCRLGQSCVVCAVTAR